MYAERFPIQWPAGIHGDPLTHLGNLGLKVDDLDFHPRNGGEILDRYQDRPDKHIVLASDTGDPEHDKAAVLYGKTSIQAGQGVYGHVFPVAPNDPSWLKGARNHLLQSGLGAHDGEVVADGGAQQTVRQPGRHDWLFDPEQQRQRVQELEQQRMPQQQPLQMAAAEGWGPSPPEPIAPGTRFTMYPNGPDSGLPPVEAIYNGQSPDGFYAQVTNLAGKPYEGGVDWRRFCQWVQKGWVVPHEGEGSQVPSAPDAPPLGLGMENVKETPEQLDSMMKGAATQTVPWFNGKPVQPGETLMSFRNEPWEFVQTLRDPDAGRSAKLLMRAADGWEQQLNYSVFPGVEMALPTMPSAPDDLSSLQGDTPEQIDQMMKGAGIQDWPEQIGDAVDNAASGVSDWVAEKMAPKCRQCGKANITGRTVCSDCAVQNAKDKAERLRTADMSTGVQMQPGQQPMGGTCPNCGNPLGPLAQQQGVCPTCRTMTSQQGGSTEQSPTGPSVMQTMPAPHQPPPGMSPRDPARMNISHADRGRSITEASEGVRSEMTELVFHIADLAPTDNSVSAEPVASEEPGTNDGPFNDASDLGEMSTDQHGAFQKAVNTAIDLLNNAAQQGLPLDVAAVSAQLAETGFPDSQKAAAYALQQPTDESGMRSYPANNDPVPDPSGIGQGAQPSAVGGGATDQVLSPMEQPSNGAFAHVKLPSGKVGHVTDTYDDMWGSTWVRVAADDGSTHDVLSEQVEPVEAPASADPVTELQAFIDAWPDPQGTVSGVQDHLNRLRTARQYISRQMHNPALGHNQRLALDKIDAELQYATLASGQAVIERSDAEQQYVNTLVNARYHTGFADGESVGGVSGQDGLDLPADVPVVPASAIERVQEEHPEVLVDAMSSVVRHDVVAVTDRAIAHIAKYTAGYPQEFRDEQQQRFVQAMQEAAVAYREPATPTTKTAAAEPSDWDGPVEAIFMGAL